MQQDTLINYLETNRSRIPSLLEGISQKQAQHKPDPESWSILEVINHIYDEAKEDFRPRRKGVLSEPDRPLPPIDPEAWVKERNYNSQHFYRSLQNFLEERDRSLSWLKSLRSPNWDQVYERGSFSIRAGDLLASWVAHDQLHMLQFIELQRELVLRSYAPYQIHNAGPW